MKHICFPCYLWSLAVVGGAAFRPLQLLQCNFSETSVDIGALREMGFTPGLCQSLVESSDVFAKRFWLIDDSGSMAIPDGKRLDTSDPDSVNFVGCTRWEEVRDTVNFHARLASALNAPTNFRFLNNPGRVKSFNVAESFGKHPDCVERIMLKTKPQGATPLVEHVLQVRDEVERMLPELDDGQQVALIIATDGVPTNEKCHCGSEIDHAFRDALMTLQDLPVLITIRLCTDDEYTVEYYNGLEAELGLNMDILDDYHIEAKEVNEHNGWLSYGLPLHRLREMGSCARILDQLDDRSLSEDEIEQVCELILGRNYVFVNKECSMTYNPAVSKVEPWIKLNEALVVA